MAGRSCMADPGGSSAVDTFLTNPGIVARLDEDVSGFACYGFSLTRLPCGMGVLHRAEAPPLPPLLALSLRVTVPSLIPTVAPLLRTLVRLLSRTDPRRVAVLLSLDAVASSDGKGDGMAISRSAAAAHALHMVVRNSMGAALFLRMTLALPWEPAEDDAVAFAMPDVAYPTVAVVGPRGAAAALEGRLEWMPALGAAVVGPLVPLKPLLGFDPSVHDLSLTVDTRNYTVNVTPLLWHLAAVIEGGPAAAPGAPADSVHCHGPPAGSFVVCVEKLANLYRVLALYRDYGRLNSLTLATHAASRARFAAEAAIMLARIDEAPLVPVLDVAGAAAVVAAVAAAGRSVVAVDLAPGALTLAAGEALPRALVDGCVVLGFEAGGIPGSLADLATVHVQMRCRSSLNLAAAVSIVLHALDTAK